MYEISKLKNGLTVASAFMPHMSSVSLGIWVAVGGRYEPLESLGISHFIEHLLFKGTRRRTAREISQSVEGLGGYLNAFTSEEHTCFYSKAARDRMPEVLDVLMDMFLNSQFARGEIVKERNVVKEELAMYLDQPHQYVHELLNETMWPDHPMGRSLLGTPDSLDRLSRSKLLAFKEKNYVTVNTLVAAAGNIRHEDFKTAVGKYAPRFTEGKKPSFQPFSVTQAMPTVRLLTKETEQTQLALGIRTCSRHDERRFALRLLNTVLGENMSSRLFQKIREDRGLAYSISSSLSFFDDVGCLSVSAGLDADQAAPTLRLIVKELNTLRRALISPAELRRARDYVIGQFDLSMENTENQMMWLGEHYLGYGKAIRPEEMKLRLRDVRAAEIRQAAEEFFRPERLNLAVISPLKESSLLSDVLR
jgi:predicted Zn-dependent peptidase